MSLILSGTEGLSDVDGTAATPAIRGTDANTGIFFPAADTIAFAEGGAECARFDSSGNFGLGVTPAAWTVYKVLQMNRGAFFSSGTNAFMGSNWFYDGADKYITSDYATFYRQTGGAHTWATAASGTAGNAITFTQAMTLDASGNLLVGTTSNTNLQNNMSFLVGSGLPGAGSACFNGTNGNTVLQVNQTLDDNAARGQIYFYRNESLIGSITSSNTTTAFNNLSDYRLKHDIQTMTGALAKVALLKPCTYKWNADGSDGEGFVAHELAEVCPHAVTGEKDAIDEDGNPKYQGVDTSFLVATLTAAIQEQQVLITTLTARITALESA